MAKGRSRFGFARFSCFGGQARTKKMAEDGHPVKKLHIYDYDLSQRMAGAVPQPPQFRPAPAPAPTAPVPVTTAPELSSDEVSATASGAGKPKADKTMDDGNGITIPPHKAVPQPPQLRPAPALAPAAATTQPSSSDEAAVERSTDKTRDNGTGSTVPPAVQPAAAQVSPTAPAAVASHQDPLVEAKRRAQEEIKREFAAIMATGTTRAGEAAALATWRVMERHGLQRAAAVQRG